MQRRLSARPAHAARKASVTWVVTEEERRLIERWGGRAERQLEVGSSPAMGCPTAVRTTNPCALFGVGATSQVKRCLWRYKP